MPRASDLPAMMPCRPRRPGSGGILGDGEGAHESASRTATRLGHLTVSCTRFGWTGTGRTSASSRACPRPPVAPPAANARARMQPGRGSIDRQILRVNHASFGITDRRQAARERLFLRFFVLLKKKCKQ